LIIACPFARAYAFRVAPARATCRSIPKATTPAHTTVTIFAISLGFCEHHHCEIVPVKPPHSSSAMTICGYGSVTGWRIARRVGHSGFTVCLPSAGGNGSSNLLKNVRVSFPRDHADTIIAGVTWVDRSDVPIFSRM
jgi:hypothetical protein